MRKHRGLVIILVIGLALVGAWYVFAGPPRTQRPLSLTRSAAPSPAEGTTESGQAVPQKAEPPPQPEVTPEERERLLDRTQRLDPKAPPNDNLPSPPGLPLTPGRETKIGPCPSDPKSSVR